MPSRLQNALLPDKAVPRVLPATDIAWMRVALKTAHEAAWRGGLSRTGEVPVAALWTGDGVQCLSGNLKESKNDPTAHAEIVVLQKVAETLGRWRLGGTLYVTLEPCAMCAGAILEARVDRLVFGAWDPKAGACGSVHNIIEERSIRHPIDVRGGVYAEESATLLKDFFAARRKKSLAERWPSSVEGV